MADLNLNKQDQEIFDANEGASIEELKELGFSAAGIKKLQKSEKGATVDIGANTEYIRYKLDVTSTVRGGKILYTGMRSRVMQTGVRIEAFRTARLNAAWHDRKEILLEVGDDRTEFTHEIYTKSHN